MLTVLFSSCGVHLNIQLKTEQGGRQNIPQLLYTIPTGTQHKHSCKIILIPALPDLIGKKKIRERKNIKILC